MSKIEVEARIEYVSPVMAEEWLACKFEDQRHVRETHVNQLLSDMESKQWRLGPDAIVLIKGKLANGQHRLLALVRYGKPLQFLVLRTNDDELYKVMDCGIKRQVGDCLKGVKFSFAVASSARWVIAYDNRTIGRYTSACTGTKIRGVYPSQSTMVDYCERNWKPFDEACSFCNPLYEKTKLLPMSIVSAVHVIGSRVDKEKTEQFIREVMVGGASNTVALDLRNRLTSNLASKARLPGGYKILLVLKALKLYFAGKRPGVLKIDEDEFPVIE